MSTLLIFDIDGTLTDTVPIHRSSFHETLLECGLSGLDPKITSFKHHTDSNIFKEIYNSQADDWEEGMLLSFELKLTERIRPKIEESGNEIPGAKEFLGHLSEKGIAFGYATGSFEKPARLKLQKAQLPLHVPLSHASSFLDRESIVQDTIRNCEAAFGSDFSRIISIGDGIWDYKTAENLGLEFLGIAKDDQASRELRAVGAKKIISNYLDFEPLLREFLSG